MSTHFLFSLFYFFLIFFFEKKKQKYVMDCNGFLVIRDVKVQLDEKKLGSVLFSFSFSFFFFFFSLFFFSFSLFLLEIVNLSLDKTERSFMYILV